MLKNTCFTQEVFILVLSSRSTFVSLSRSIRVRIVSTRRGSRIQKGGGAYIQKGAVYRNFRSGSKLLQGPGQINKQKKLQTAVGGGGSDHPPKKPVSAPEH